MNLKIASLLLLTLMNCVTITGQNNKKKITISGHVSDADHKPVTYAVILVDSIKTANITNQYGTYEINVKPNAKEIGIFTDKTGVISKPINGRTKINFNLSVSFNQQDDNKMSPDSDEEINVGYGSVKKKNLTQSVSKMDEKAKRYASYRTIYELIRGELAGVQVNGTSIKVQGASSIGYSTEPLLVVDGVVTNSIDNISPQMVKSLEVLKGSSASIYGSRGANGVILINLKGSKDIK
jgi:TonB-dependent SusC/RagA subfamily outer membrane receptor